MIGVLTGFAVIAVIVLVGYLVGRLGVLGEHAGFVLGRIGFAVLTPCLLLTVLSEADIAHLFSALLPVSAIAAVAVGLLFAAVARFVWRRPVSETVVGSLASGYVNANNIGIPVSLYVLGDPALSAPVVLLQMLVFAPIALTILDSQTRGVVSLRRVLLQPVTNPLVVASVLGVLIAVTGVQLPAAVLEPFKLIGGAAVPVILIAFGISLHGQRPLAPGTARRDVVLATALKLTVMPLVAWSLGRFVFSLDGEQLFAVTVLAALPSAQNVFNYAQRYERGVILARDVVLLTTIGAVPVIALIAALLAR
ncbi:AEC family transporter [Leifsonia sp. H3M29-4]|uniref:AEC family transporter n=1 Tax=Salinibacterium metalliresistens TaxID=3031321 RepID=UPI0023DC30A9|nr:AEC family transporter [Salinibacterium metalliresistens]MDF1477622.1 AEC family transporter [Salinibacterium metalliresistens]